jgi:hypothetical protein
MKFGSYFVLDISLCYVLQSSLIIAINRIDFYYTYYVGM